MAVRVALLAEGVDRNSVRCSYNQAAQMSPSSRRAWIEICWKGLEVIRDIGRPPRGGRG